MCYKTKIIIHHIDVVTKPARTLKLYFLTRNISLRIAKLYICIVLVNFRNIYVKYSHLLSYPLSYPLLTMVTK